MQHYSPPPPRVTYPGVVAREITDKFASAVKKLEPGELVKDEHFTLFEAVSALEIMDPKMDSGFLAEGESLDEEYDVSRELLPEEILGIIDQLLCLETLLTSVYVEAILNPTPTNITEADFARDPGLHDRRPKLLFILRAYCVGLLKACHLVNELVKAEHYYEEEDFVTNTYDRSLLCDIEVKPILDVLQQARIDLRALRNEVPVDISTALDIRLELRIVFLRAIDLMSMGNVNADSLKTPWIQMRVLLDHFDKQHSLAKAVPEAFSTKLQRRLASTMPPRPIVQTSFEETASHFKQLFQDGIDITKVLKYSDPQSLLTFVTTFQARKPQPLVFIRSLLQTLLIKDRVVLRTYDARQIIDQDLALTVLPWGKQIDPSYVNVEVPSDPRHQIAAQMANFRARVTESYLDIFRIFCQNRCRVRRTLCHSIHEWDMLQAEVEETDQLLQVTLEEKPLTTDRGDIGYRLPLSSWAYLYKLRQMEWIVQLGFELAIYQPDELAGMYWYLNYLAKTRAQHGDRIKAFTSRALSQERQAGGYTAARDREYMRSLSYIRSTMLDAACTWEFADGLCCLYTTLQRLGLVRPFGPQPRPYSDDERRYRIRTRPFAAIALPQLPTFDEFTRATSQPETGIPDLLKYASSAIAGARKGYEALAKLPDQQAFCVRSGDRWRADVHACQKAAIAAGIAVTQLAKAFDVAAGAVDGGEGERMAEGESSLDVGLRVEFPEPGKGYHDWWIVPRLIPTSSEK
ncbi:hypothetical protein DL766_000366 [Monosporascus sp. MC13-8B]|uniref:Uncharacterized protein n=1 Tax=Monosporascus cannonballus TaxID=155416 RepID=A0ABY0HJT8_9PEZI|nr:hypothetical protein DL762_001676 [Monosporascus cannonballus]RYO99974.1 hypothetical protein DL763_001105 [Monosporascus cannonballus]RYP39544.1 hypothetical protein DL766_000366 [Monosporascus sp. MC13-8B]